MEQWGGGGGGCDWTFLKLQKFSKHFVPKGFLQRCSIHTNLDTKSKFIIALYAVGCSIKI